MDIYVGNLSYDAEEGELRDAFAAHGNVDRVQIVQDKFTGKSRGFAFVTMGDWKEAQAAIKALNGAQIGGRAITCNQARAREERGGGGGFRDRGDRR